MLDIGLAEGLDSGVDRCVSVDVEQPVKSEEVRLEGDFEEAARREGPDGGADRRGASGVGEDEQGVRVHLADEPCRFDDALDAFPLDVACDDSHHRIRLSDRVRLP